MRRFGPGTAGFAALVLLVALTPVAGARRPPNCWGKRPTILGTPDDDEIKGTPGRDVIYTDGGNDLIKGRGGNDLICPGAGEDDVYGQGGDDKLDAGPSSGATELYGGRGDDLLFDDPHNDDSQWMFGGPGNDTLKAADNNGTDTDRLDGGPGDDVMEQGASHSVFIAGPGNDVMRAGELGGFDDEDRLTYSASGAGVDVDLQNGTATGELDGSDTVEGFEILIGSEHDDQLSGDDDDNFIFGKGGSDVIEGGDGDDCLYGEHNDHLSCHSPPKRPIGGDDVIRGDEGDDHLVGAGGNDDYVGGGGLDIASFHFSPAGVRVDLAAMSATGEGTDTVAEVETVWGSEHADELLGDDGPNRLEGHAGSNDIVRGRGGVDMLIDLFGGSGTLDGGDGADVVDYSEWGGGIRVSLADGTDSLGNSLADIEDVLGPLGRGSIITGDANDNRLVGGRDGDQIQGGDGNDTIRGRDGPDRLDGGPGSDSIDGGRDADTCNNGEFVSNCE